MLPHQPLGGIVTFFVIDLVENKKHRLLKRIDLIKYGMHRIDLHFDLRMRGIDHVHNQIGLCHFFLNESTRWCGSFWINPTVSVINAGSWLGRSTCLVVGSSVAKS